MFLFVWIAFLLLQKSLCFQPEGLVSSTESSIKGQNPTSSYLEEVTGNRNLTGTPVVTSLESQTDDNHPECSNNGGCTSQLDSSSIASPKITWSPAVSLSVTLKDVDSFSTISSGKSESETDVINHPTTPDFYGTLNHNENELDFDVKEKEQHFTQTVDNITNENLFGILNVTHFSQEISSPFTGVPSENVEESTHLPAILNVSLSEHLLKISSLDNLQSSFPSASTMHTTSSSTGTTSQFDPPGTKSVESSSVHLLLRSTRNTASTDEMGNTDHTVLDTKSASSMQPAKLLVSTTIDPNLVKVNFKTDDSFETLGVEESSLQPHFLNLTKDEKSEDPVSTDHSVETSTPQSTADSTSIQEGEVSSGARILSTPHSLKETTTYSSPPSLPENIKEIQTSTLSSQTIDVTNPLVYSLGHKLVATSTTMEPISLENHKTTEETLNSKDVISSTISHVMNDSLKTIGEDQEGRSDNDSYQFNKISLTKGTTLPFEENSSTYLTTSSDALDETKYFPTTAEMGGLQNTSVDHSTAQSINSIMGEEETTVSSVLTTAKTNFAGTSVMEHQPSDSTSLTSLSLDGQPTSQPPSSTADLTMLPATTEHSTFSSSTDFLSPSTNVKVSPRFLNQTLSNALDQVSSTTLSQSSHSSATDEVTVSSSIVQSTPSSSVDQISTSSVNQTPPSTVYPVASSSIDPPLSLSTKIDETTSTSTIGHPSTGTLVQSTTYGLIAQKSSRTFQESTSFSSVDLNTATYRSKTSSTLGERNRILTSEIENIDTSVTPDSPSSTMPPKTSAGIHVFPSMLLTTTVSSKETSSKSELSDVTDPLQSTRSPSDYTSTPTSNVATETHREGKHIPFSTESSRRQTVESSNEVIFLTSTKESEIETTTINLKEVIYNQLYYEDLKLSDKSNVITAVVQLPSQDVNNIDLNVKIAEVHSFLEHVLMKEFQNWTRDPFDVNGDQLGDTPFGKVTIFYISPTPKTKSSNITMTFIVHNEWRNETLPVDFLLSILNFYSADLRQSMNVSSVHFYHGLLIDDSDLLPVILEKYGVIVFTTALAVIGSALLICIVIIYRKRNRRSVHYLANSKLQHNLQESVGIDLTPAVVILQDEKKILNGNSKICDDEGWLVPIHEVPLAEDTNMPKVQDTKL